MMFRLAAANMGIEAMAPASAVAARLGTTAAKLIKTTAKTTV